MDNSSFRPLLSEKATALDYRDDLQLVTSPVATEAGNTNLTMPGLQLLTTPLPFGNNGSANYGASVTTSNSSDLSDLSNRSTILSDLTTATDHLPVVADYTIVPSGDFNRDGKVDSADIPLMMSVLTNLSAYETSTGLNFNQVLEIGDVNGDHST